MVLAREKKVKWGYAGGSMDAERGGAGGDGNRARRAGLGDAPAATVLGFGFPRAERAALIAAEPAI